MQPLDLSASRWASAEVRREREYHNRTRTPSPQKQVRDTKLPNTASAPTSSASTAPPLSSAQRLLVTRQTELQRFRRLFRRVAWKANSLTHWSHRALNLAQEHQSHNHTIHAHPGGVGPRASLGRYEMIIDPIEAERQFKIDFHEFYALLERGLVYLLGVWGIVITSSAPTTDHEQSRSTATPFTPINGSSAPIIGDSRTFHGASHRFHANVLAALDHPLNPLHAILGTGDTREYIGVAKEFRNKWKDVEQRPDDSFKGTDRAEEAWDKKKVRRYEDVLRDLKLDELLGTILAALEDAGRKAEEEVKRLETLVGGANQQGKGISKDVEDMDLDMEDSPFEAMPGRASFDFEMEL
ncbi:hypothetical protein EDD36DRAFT_426485 [Exophiala viscosa]|uniref:Uncharacterized protein n=1 Tax=Exophiala viscosa TaxID=2486360 RepID=A0AAN6E7I0_9EURO|nr:hypothetical protein EDD36DRAFT_426485 [Exophiala viscosa]